MLGPFSQASQKQEVYEELKRLTHGFTKLGPSYELEDQSLTVEGESSRDDFGGMFISFVLIASRAHCSSPVPPFISRLLSSQNR